MCCARLGLGCSGAVDGSWVLLVDVVCLECRAYVRFCGVLDVSGLAMGEDMVIVCGEVGGAICLCDLGFVYFFD